MLEENRLVFDLGKAPLAYVLALFQVVRVLLIGFDNLQHFRFLEDRCEVLFGLISFLGEGSVDDSRKFNIDILAFCLLVDVDKVLLQFMEVHNLLSRPLRNKLKVGALFHGLSVDRVCADSRVEFEHVHLG